MFPRMPPSFIRAACALVVITAYAVALILSGGCSETNRESVGITHMRREFQESGTSGGVPFNKTGTEVIVTDTKSNEVVKAGLDMEQVKAFVATALAAATTAGKAAVPGFGLMEGLVTAATVLLPVLTGTAMHLRTKGLAAEKRGNEHRDDAAEGWKKSEEAQARAEAHALARDPRSATIH